MVTPTSSARRLGEPRADQPLGEDRGDALLVDQVLQPGQVGRGRLGVGGEAGDRLERPGRTCSEVAERVVARPRPCRARSRPGPASYAASSALEVGAQVGGVGARSRRRGRGRPRRAASATASPRSAIRSGSCQKCGSRSPWSWPSCRVLVLGVLSRSTDVGRVEHLALGVLVDGVVDRRLEAVLVDHQVGVARRRRSPGRSARGRAARCPGWVRFVDLGVVAGDPLGDVLQRVERGRDLHARRRRPAASSENAAQPRQAPSSDGTAASDDERRSHENDSQCKMRIDCQLATAAARRRRRAGGEQVPGARRRTARRSGPTLEHGAATLLAERPGYVDGDDRPQRRRPRRCGC